jgi:hypothetical protein
MWFAIASDSSRGETARRRLEAPKEDLMPLFVAAVVAAGRVRRPATVAIPVSTPSLWKMVSEEIAIATRALFTRLLGRRNRH